MHRRRKIERKKDNDNMFYSQYGQDAYVKKKIFKDKKNGVFIDVGAYDGKIYNNTLYFEENDNWSGINVEPNKHIFELLEKNRPNCININTAVSDKEEELDFISVKGGPEMISGLLENYDPRHEERLEFELKRDGGEKNIIKIKTKRLESIFDEYNIKKVDYLSIDVEGAEMSVIKSINFDKVFIDLIEFENNFLDVSKEIVDYLKEKNYIQCEIINSVDIFMLHKDSVYLNNYYN